LFSLSYFLIYENSSFILKKNLNFASPIRSVQWNPIKPQLVAGGSFDGQIFIIDITDGKYETIKTLNSGNGEKMMTVAWHPCFDYILATGSADHCVRVWDLKNVS
jgi:protein transport protein SEC31